MQMPRSLRARLLIANLIVAGVALGTVAVAVSLVGPGYFADAMGHRPGDPMGMAMDAATRGAFVDAVRNALVAASLIAVATAVIVSLAVSGRIAGPVARLAVAARRIAGGHYAERVPERGEGEIADLATTFNAMAGSLEATERRRLQLVGDVAHELRTPLSTLDGYLEGLEDGVIAPTDETWRLLRGETARLTRLVNELAELWRAEAHQLPLKMESVDLAAVCRDVAERFAPAAEARRIAITLDLGAVEPAFADRDRVVQILSNYLSNAIRYSPEGSAVTVSARAAGAAGTRVVVAVADQGPGLDRDQLQAVFERFYRVDPSRTRALGGAGIGLAIVRALAEAMDGRAWAESAGPGKGSRFLVELPTA
jgi:two-component system, OmpR family, sensor histidine kinase BaeS